MQTIFIQMESYQYFFFFFFLANFTKGSFSLFGFNWKFVFVYTWHDVIVDYPW